MNGSQSFMLKGLKGGLSYRVRLVARGHHDEPLHLSEELVVTVPGEALPCRSGLAAALCVECVVCRLCSSAIESSMGLTDAALSVAPCGGHVL